MKVYYEKDVFWEIDQAILKAQDENEKIEVIELDRVESRFFLEDVGPLLRRGVVIKEFDTYLYRQTEIRLTVDAN